jgi:phosphoglycolate phosphatase-like HAD superfamily hydrolase
VAAAGAEAGVTGAVLVDLDGALGDTRPLWAAWLADTARVLGVDPATMPEDRGEAASLLDRTGGNWRVLLERYAADRAPVYLRPAAEASAALRRLAASGARIGVFSDAPRELALVAAAQLGATRRAEAIEAGEGALERLRGRFGGQAVVVLTRAELIEASA